MNKIRITAGKLVFEATLNDNDTAHRIWDALPIEGRGSIWGDEIYFSIPVNLEQAADAVEEVTVGTLAYWPPGSALCIFFGPTPVSRGDEPRAYSPVNVFGTVTGNVQDLRSVRNGTTILVEKA